MLASICLHLLAFAWISLYLHTFDYICLDLIVFACICLYLFACLHLFAFAWFLTVCSYLLAFDCISSHALLVFAYLCLYLPVLFACICLYLLVSACICLHLLHKWFLASIEYVFFEEPPGINKSSNWRFMNARRRLHVLWMCLHLLTFADICLHLFNVLHLLTVACICLDLLAFS